MKVGHRALFWTFQWMPSVYALRYKRCAFVAHCEKAWLGNQARLPLSHVGWISTPARLVVHLFQTSMSMVSGDRITESKSLVRTTRGLARPFTGSYEKFLFTAIAHV